MMTLRLALRFARRELRAGLRGFWVFLACLTLGVGAIAAVGSVRAAIEAGLHEQGAVLLGGDARMRFSYRFASAAERDWMAARALRVSEVVDFRSMAVVGDERALTQVKAVDGGWPLLGQAELDPPMPVATALGEQDGLPGAVLDPVLIDRLGLAIGDVFKLGAQEFRLSAALRGEPDNASGGFGLGPRTLVRSAALATSGLLQPGTVFETEYRMILPEGADLEALKEQAQEQFRDTGMRWQDRRNGAPGVERFVDRIGSFLVLVGLAGLIVGGVGVSAAVRAYLGRKTAVIATLKALGAEERLIFALYFTQIGALALLGIAGGLVIGAGLPLALAPLLEGYLPLPARFGLHPGALAEAALYGALTAFLFTLWPLSRTVGVRAAALFRGTVDRGVLPRPAVLAGLVLGLAALLATAVAFSGVPGLALATTGGIALALAALGGAALILRAFARRMAGRDIVRGRPALRLALAAVGGKGEGVVSVVLSLGLGLAVLASVGQISANLQRAIDSELPKVAPSYFFVDIQGGQLDGFLDRLRGDPAVSRVDTAPMLRGVLTRINGQPAREVAGDHWMLRGDRGVTYSAALPENTTLVEGAWWAEDYAGPPLVSFGAEQAKELGLKLGDAITVNILGRDLDATIASLRAVDFSTAGIGFVMSFNPAAVVGAPHSHIATLYVDQAAEAAILRDLAQDYPNVTAIRVRDAIAQGEEALSAISVATAYASGVTLLIGLVVLIGTAAAGESARVYEAALLKVLGAARGRILFSFALRSALMGGAAGLVAIGAGALAGWAVMRFVMDAPFRFEPVFAVLIVLAGLLATLAAGLGFAWRPLAARPAQVLRARE